MTWRCCTHGGSHTTVELRRCWYNWTIGLIVQNRRACFHATLLDFTANLSMTHGQHFHDLTIGIWFGTCCSCVSQHVFCAYHQQIAYACNRCPSHECGHYACLNTEIYVSLPTISAQYSIYTDHTNNTIVLWLFTTAMLSIFFHHWYQQFAGWRSLQSTFDERQKT
jgi:hypothetical protein